MVLPVVGYAFTKEAFGEFSGSAGHPSTAWLDSWTPENKNASMPRIAEARVSPSEASNVLSDSGLWTQAISV